MPATPTPPLAALTTIFTPPCPTTWLLSTTRVPSQYPDFPTTGPASCDPPSWVPNIAGKGFQYYSPAICPSGFSVGSGCAISRTPTAEGFTPVTDGETVAWCVPSGQTCTSDTTDFRGGVWGFARAETVTVGPAVQIRWRDSDLSLLETHPLTPGLQRAASGGSGLDIPFVGTILQFSTQTAGETSPTPAVAVSMGVVNTATAASSSLPVLAPTSSTGLGSSSSATETSTSSSMGIQSSSSMSGAVIAAIVLASLLTAAILFSIILFLHLRQRRRSGYNRSSQPIPVGVGVWLRRGHGSTIFTEKRTWDRQSGRGLDLGIVVRKAPLPVQDTDTESDMAVPTGWSWMPRVTRLFSLQSSRGLSSSTPSSRWTRLDDEIGSASPGWIDGLSVPAAAYLPRRSTLRTVASAQSLTSESSKDVQLLPDLPKFDRTSEGTFGSLIDFDQSERPSREGERLE